MTRFGQAVSTLGASRGARALRAMLVASVAGLSLSACQDSEGLNSGRAWKPIPRETLALMEAKGTTKHAPILVRAFKKEAELEIWKAKADGTYTLLKTYPVCRWSGQLGPKTREGDRQVPEGFYSVSPGLMNPNSNYYLAFNIGYPNAYDRVRGYTGGLIMVHGDCSSAGCFAMTNEQIAEIYAIAREAFAGGQRNIQVQSMPFRMTPENLARYRLDPNMKFWNEIKEGYDHFEVTKREPQVAFCGRRYVFNATSANGEPLDVNAPCPPLRQDQEIANLVAEKRKAEQAKVAELVSKGVRPVRLKFADGGQHPSFAHVTRVSRPEALAQGPTEIVLDDGKPSPVVQVAAARTQPAAAQASSTPAASSQPAQTAARPAPTNSSSRPASQQATAPGAQQPAAAFAPEQAPTAAAAPFYKRWLGFGASEQPAPEAAPAPPAAATAPADRRQRGAATTPRPASEQATSQPQRSSELPPIIRGAQPVLPAGLMAYTQTNR
jgi:murein L,D-transpeptidase YafK